MQYFPQHVLFCTSTVHDQSGDICIQGYLRILWIGNAKSLKIDNLNLTPECNKWLWDVSQKRWHGTVAYQSFTLLNIRKGQFFNIINQIKVGRIPNHLHKKGHLLETAPTVQRTLFWSFQVTNKAQQQLRPEP